MPRSRSPQACTPLRKTSLESRITTTPNQLVEKFCKLKSLPAKISLLISVKSGIPVFLSLTQNVEIPRQRRKILIVPDDSGLTDNGNESFL